jgi:hypothetical protein
MHTPNETKCRTYSIVEREFSFKFAALICEVILNLRVKRRIGPHQTGLLWTRPCGVKPRPASPNCHVRSALLRVLTQCRFVFPYWRFGTIYRSHLQGIRNPKERTEHYWSSLSQYSFLGLCSSSNFLKKQDISEIGCFHRQVKKHETYIHSFFLVRLISIGLG